LLEYNARQRFVRRRLWVRLEHRGHVVHRSTPFIAYTLSPGVTRPLS
jgi:hypothetical protein